VILTLASLQSASIEKFSLAVFNYWRLGQLAKNNGVLLLVAANEHKVRIEVGYGLEHLLTNAKASKIIEGSIIPQFRANDFSDGITRGVDAIIQVLTEGTPHETSGQSGNIWDTIDANGLTQQVTELEKQGRYFEASPLAQRALALYEKALGHDHPHVATALGNLAELYRRQGRYADAEALYKRSSAILEKVLGPDHPTVAASLNNLALLYDAHGRHADAEPLYKRCLAIQEKALGPAHPDVAKSFNNLAILYRNQGRYADAEALYNRSLPILEKALGSDHPDIATLLSNLAELYRIQGRYTDAEALYNRSLSIREKTLGPDHPDVAASLGNLAALYGSQRRYADAEALYNRLLPLLEKALGPDHPSIATSLIGLAVLYQAQGRCRPLGAAPRRHSSPAGRRCRAAADHPRQASVRLSWRSWATQDSADHRALVSFRPGAHLDMPCAIAASLAISARSLSR
jgi:tetratricopeptide (TPR) repeat protein